MIIFESDQCECSRAGRVAGEAARGGARLERAAARALRPVGLPAGGHPLREDLAVRARLRRQPAHRVRHARRLLLQGKHILLIYGK